MIRRAMIRPWSRPLPAGRRCTAIVLLSLLISMPLRAQATGGVVSGTVRDPSGKGVSNARVSVTNVTTGQSTATLTDSAGLYEALGLTPGDYEVSVSAAGFRTVVSKVTISGGAPQTLDVSLGDVLSLGDLGFSPAQTLGNAQDQATLDKRSHMLKLHQQLGLLATVPLVATVILGKFAGGRTTSSTDRTVHASLGALTVGLYGASAYYAIFAPKVLGTPTRGNIRLHKALAWVHGAGMILTPVLGEMAYRQRSRGENVHGIASAHGAVGIVTAAAYAAAIVAESLK
jgi:Carboxypeptidase regulatory-like domain